MKKMKRINILFLLALICAPLSLLAQEEEKKPARPVYETFNSGLLGDQQTMMSPREKGLEFIIHHRFGKIKTIDDVFGLYAPSNIRLGLDYGIKENLMVGVGYEKNSKLLELHGKYTILHQTRQNEMPVSLTYYANFATDMRSLEDGGEIFGQNYGFANRFTFFHQLIVSRKFNDKFSAQVSGSYAHFNATDSIYQHDHLGVSAGLKYNLFGNFSVIANYDQPMPITIVRYFQADHFPKPNLGVGMEIATGTHCFQLFAANYDKITPQKNLAYNQNDLLKGQFLVGMNVLVRF